MTALARLLDEAARGRPPAPDGGPTLLPQPSPGYAGVIAFTAHNVIFADVGSSWILDRLPTGDLSAPLNPPFLGALEERLGRKVHNVDQLLLGRPLTGPLPLPLTEIADSGHPRVRRALRYRDQVRVWAGAGGVLVLGRGVAERWEVAVEVDEERRGNGLGRALATAARHLAAELPAQALWAQVAPGNAASVRAFLAAGYTPVGAEALLTP
jgi:GNAT superfamily N-acetyltransferase